MRKERCEPHTIFLTSKIEKWVSYSKIGLVVKDTPLANSKGTTSWLWWDNGVKVRT